MLITLSFIILACIKVYGLGVALSYIKECQEKRRQAMISHLSVNDIMR